MKLSKPLLTSVFLSSFALVLNAQQGKPLFGDPVKVDELNSKAEESMPLPFSKNDDIYFVRTYIEGTLKQRRKGQDVWVASKSEGHWSQPSNAFEKVNDDANNAIVGVSKEGKRVYIFNSIQTHKKLAQGLAYKDLLEDGKWSSEVKMNIPGLEIGEGLYSFYFNPDESVLLVSKTTENDSLSSADLFVSLKQGDGSWGSLISLGTDINTDGNEITPFILDDKKTLYFSSTGHKGMGGADVFVSYRLDDSWTKWTQPYNLGAPINSEAFDAYFVATSKNEVYFSSNRGQQYSDIYTAKLLEAPKPMELKSVQEIAGQFYFDGQPIKSVQLEVYDVNDKRTKSITTVENGAFCCLDTGWHIIKLDKESKKLYSDGKIYLLDENGEKGKRLKKIAQGIYSKNDNVGLVEGKVDGHGLSNKEIKLNLYDDEGNFIKEIVTDETGSFTYTQLTTDKNYIIKVVEEDQTQLSKPELWVKDPGSEEMLRMESNRYEKSYPVQQAKIAQVITGKASLDGKLLKGTKINLYNAKGELVKQVITDENGEFAYSKLSADENYILKIDSEDNLDADLFVFDPVSEEMVKMDRKSVIQKNGYELNRTLTYTEVEGLVNIDGKAREGVKVNLYNSKGEFVKQVITDKEGKFSYSKLSMDDNYIVKIDSEESNIDGALELYLKDQLSDELVLVSETMKEKGFALPTKKEETKAVVKNIPIAKEEVKNVVATTVVKEEPKEEKIPVYVPSGEVVETLFFDFNSFFMDNADRAKLNKVIRKMKMDKSLRVSLVGHTDTSGTEKVNTEVSAMRAKRAMIYMLSMGISEDRIEHKGVRDMQPIASNATREGRMKNRRVEVFFVK
jgi:outer membrane protein OmpA-like peptidoglycan-associated protein